MAPVRRDALEPRRKSSTAGGGDEIEIRWGNAESV
jgi:hypothetical protein